MLRSGAVVQHEQRRQDQQQLHNSRQHGRLLTALDITHARRPTTPMSRHSQVPGVTSIQFAAGL
jgi:hypothetical protein